MSAEETPERTGRRGVDRRKLLKGAAAAGVAAWSAPLIINSLTSPAAAESGGATPPPSGTYLYVFRVTYDGVNGCNAALLTADCAPGYCASPNFRVIPTSTNVPVVTPTFACTPSGTQVDQGICWSTDVGTFTQMEHIFNETCSPVLDSDTYGCFPANVGTPPCSPTYSPSVAGIPNRGYLVDNGTVNLVVLTVTV